MIHRTISEILINIAKKMPVITITGPRQSGKTTLARSIFPNHTYINLEHPDNLQLATDNPTGFFDLYPSNLILDEIQRAPKLLSYIQVIVDENKQTGQFILTGSENLLLSEKVTQSLAGRTYLTTLLPLSLEELQSASISYPNYMSYIYHGFYPRLYDDKEVAPSSLFPSYIRTYVERDVRQIINIRDLRQFQLFLKLCAGHIGQVINYTSFSNAIGVNDKTIKEWFSILEATYIAYTLQPYYKNFKKRLIKSPKLYFYDTGLACSLLGIHDTHSLAFHSLQGSLFENFIIVELLKRYFNRGLQPNFYFWRENNGIEVDCLIERGNELFPIEIKSTQTFSSSLPTGNLKKVSAIMEDGYHKVRPCLIYGGNFTVNSQGVEVISWKNLDTLF
jgi:predicted AAA+ superfamily ATPase